MSIEFDMSGFVKDLSISKSQLLKAVAEGIQDSTDHLLIASTNEAPLDKGILRMTAGQEVKTDGDTVTGEVFFSAVEDGGAGRYNYALRVHEMGEYKNPTTPGTKPKFLSRPLQTNSDLYRKFISDAIKCGGRAT